VSNLAMVIDRPHRVCQLLDEGGKVLPVDVFSVVLKINTSHNDEKRPLFAATRTYEY
jgi:hypothetical protein